jgi:ubiquinone/menaquinone biosynthesis C-methylase UbiE
MTAIPLPTKRAYRGAPMEGAVATWYAKQTAKLSAEFGDEARRIAAHLAPGARLLEVAPGPGYLAVAIAKLGPYEVVGLDISRSFVRIARRHAADAGVDIEFRQGDAAALPFPDGAFDFIVCRAAFKNFGNPVGALEEMHRALRPGGEALVIDMRRDATNAALDAAVRDMGLGPVSAVLNRFIFRQLRKRAYSSADFRRMAEATPFGGAEIVESPMGLDVWLRR